MIEFRFFDEATTPEPDPISSFADGTLLGTIEDGEIHDVETDTDTIYASFSTDAISSFEDLISIVHEDMLNGVIDPIATIRYRGYPSGVRAAIPTDTDQLYVWNEFSRESIGETATKVHRHDCQLGTVEQHEVGKYKNITTSGPEPIFKEYETDKQYINAQVFTINQDTSESTYIGTINTKSDVVTDGDADRLRQLIAPLTATIAPSLNPVGLLIGNAKSTTRGIQIVDPDEDNTYYTDPYDIKRDPDTIINELK